MQAIEAKLERNQLVVLDGATGTELRRRGAPLGGESWSAMPTLTHPDLLRQIHVEYIEAGADLIITNTFATSRSVLGPVGQGDKVVAINERAVEIALEAREQADCDRPIAVAGSISHWRPWNRAELDPSVLPSDQAMAENMAEMAEILVRSGCDLLMLEMMCHPVWAPATVRAARASGVPVWVGLSARLNANGVLGTPGEFDLPFEEVCPPIVAEGGNVFGIMHTNRAQVSNALAILREHWHGPLMVYPDSERATRPGGEGSFDDDLTPERFAAACEGWAEEGVQILGACCGLSLEHLEAMIQRLGANPGPG
jgi:S-methylmethionine-dependent homocysteine/selenocysteine methylase